MLDNWMCACVCVVRVQDSRIKSSTVKDDLVKLIKQLTFIFFSFPLFLVVSLDFSSQFFQFRSFFRLLSANRIHQNQDG